MLSTARQSRKQSFLLENSFCWTFSLTFKTSAFVAVSLTPDLFFTQEIRQRLVVVTEWNVVHVLMDAQGVLS